MKLVVALGNYGNEYKFTRHNVGFYLIDKFAESKSLDFKKEKKYFFAKYKNLLMIKPTTYMNLSGQAVTSVKTKYGFDDILVIVDDINLPLSMVRIRESGGDGGHNGLKSISEALGSKNYKRIRIGVGKSDEERDLKDYVLSRFSDEELEKIDEIVPFINEILELYATKDFKSILDYNSKNNPILKKNLESKDQRRVV